jgi:hypothetical protein
VSALGGLLFVFAVHGWRIVMPSLITAQVVGVGSVSSSVSSSDDSRGDRAFGFHLESFCHVFTPVIPLVPAYHRLRGEGRGVQTSARDLCVEVFVRGGGTACLRVVCYESIPLSHWVLFDSQ